MKIHAVTVEGRPHTPAESYSPFRDSQGEWLTPLLFVDGQPIPGVQSIVRGGMGEYKDSLGSALWVEDLTKTAKPRRLYYEVVLRIDHDDIHREFGRLEVMVKPEAARKEYLGVLRTLYADNKTALALLDVLESIE